MLTSNNTYSLDNILNKYKKNNCDKKTGSRLAKICQNNLDHGVISNTIESLKKIYINSYNKGNQVNEKTRLAILQSLKDLYTVLPLEKVLRANIVDIIIDLHEASKSNSDNVALKSIQSILGNLYKNYEVEFISLALNLDSEVGIKKEKNRNHLFNYILSDESKETKTNTYLKDDRFQKNSFRENLKGYILKNVMKKNTKGSIFRNKRMEGIFSPNDSDGHDLYLKQYKHIFNQLLIENKNKKIKDITVIRIMRYMLSTYYGNQSKFSLDPEKIKTLFPFILNEYLNIENNKNIESLNIRNSLIFGTKINGSPENELSTKMSFLCSYLEKVKKEIDFFKENDNELSKNDFAYELDLIDGVFKSIDRSFKNSNEFKMSSWVSNGTEKNITSKEYRDFFAKEMYKDGKLKNVLLIDKIFLKYKKSLLEKHKHAEKFANKTKKLANNYDENIDIKSDIDGLVDIKNKINNAKLISHKFYKELLDDLEKILKNLRNIEANNKKNMLQDKIKFQNVISQVRDEASSLNKIPKYRDKILDSITAAENLYLKKDSNKILPESIYQSFRSDMDNIRNNIRLGKQYQDKINDIEESLNLLDTSLKLFKDDFDTYGKYKKELDDDLILDDKFHKAETKILDEDLKTIESISDITVDNITKKANVVGYEVGQFNKARLYLKNSSLTNRELIRKRLDKMNDKFISMNEEYPESYHKKYQDEKEQLDQFKINFNSENKRYINDRVKGSMDSELDVANELLNLKTVINEVKGAMGKRYGKVDLENKFLEDVRSFKKLEEKYEQLKIALNEYDHDKKFMTLQNKNDLSFGITRVKKSVLEIKPNVKKNNKKYGFSQLLKLSFEAIREHANKGRGRLKRGLTEEKRAKLDKFEEKIDSLVIKEVDENKELVESDNNQELFDKIVTSPENITIGLTKSSWCCGAKDDSNDNQSNVDIKEIKNTSIAKVINGHTWAGIWGRTTCADDINGELQKKANQYFDDNSVLTLKKQKEFAPK